MENRATTAETKKKSGRNLVLVGIPKLAVYYEKLYTPSFFLYLPPTEGMDGGQRV